MSIAVPFLRWLARFLAIAGAVIAVHNPDAMAHEARPAYLELTETLPSLMASLAMCECASMMPGETNLPVAS